MNVFHRIFGDAPVPRWINAAWIAAAIGFAAMSSFEAHQYWKLVQRIEAAENGIFISGHLLDRCFNELGLRGSI